MSIQSGTSGWRGVAQAWRLPVYETPAGFNYIREVINEDKIFPGGFLVALLARNHSFASTQNLNQQRTWRCFLSRVANTYWVDERISSQRVLPRTPSTLPSVRELSLDLIGTRTDVRRRGGVIP